MATPETPQQAPAEPALKLSCRARLRRKLLPLLAILTALSWLLYTVSWFVEMTDAEFTENSLNSSAYPAAAQMHRLWAVGNGTFHLYSPTTPVPSASPNLAYPAHFAQIRNAGTRYRLTLIRHAWGAGASGSMYTTPTFTHEFGVDSPTSTPHLLAAVHFAPDFDTADLWRWRYDTGNGVWLSFPLWAALLIPTLTLTAAGIRRQHNRNRSRQGLCAQCGYSRAGIDKTAPCPECGWRNSQMAKGQMAK